MELLQRQNYSPIQRPKRYTTIVQSGKYKIWMWVRDPGNQKIKIYSTNKIRAGQNRPGHGSSQSLQFPWPPAAFGFAEEPTLQSPERKIDWSKTWEIGLPLLSSQRFHRQSWQRKLPKSKNGLIQGFCGSATHFPIDFWASGLLHCPWVNYLMYEKQVYHQALNLSQKKVPIHPPYTRPSKLRWSCKCPWVLDQGLHSREHHRQPQSSGNTKRFFLKLKIL